MILRHETGEKICRFALKTETLLDEVQAGGRIQLIIGRGLTDRARKSLGLGPYEVFRRPRSAADSGKGYTLAQKIVGKACEWQGYGPVPIVSLALPRAPKTPPVS